MRLTEIASRLKAELVLPPGSEEDAVVKRIAPIQDAQPGDITFLSNPEYAKYLPQTKASAVILKDAHEDVGVVQIVHKNPYWAYAKVAQLFHMSHRGPTGIADEAFIAEDAKLGDDITVYPFAFIASDAEIGDRTVVFPGAYVGSGAKIGHDSVLYPNCFIGRDVEIGNYVIVHAGAAIGTDGFGFAIGDESIEKVPQLGTVKVEDHVEIGALCSIDRAALEATTIGKGSKLDSKVHKSFRDSNVVA